jgi:8-amino-7-oxononanoate synthase
MEQLLRSNTNIDDFKEVNDFMVRYNGFGLDLPYFRNNNGLASNRVIINGEEKINYSTYNYLGLNGSLEINEYAKSTIDKFGTSVSGSRLLSGQIDLHEKLEKKISEFLDVEDSVVQVGGHSTNVNTIGNIVGTLDLIIYDNLAHNSIVQGAILSHAKVRTFRHNNIEHLEHILIKIREKFRRVLIIVEGVYSMDGDICNLPELIRIKRKYGAILMIDEAHSFGVIGENGRGVTSYYNIDAKEVDIIMGTLSKSAASCGGYIAGSRKFINYLRYNSPGFVFSCGMTPANTAAALKAILLIEKGEERFQKLRENSEFILSKMKELGFNTGFSKDTPIVPLIIGDSQKTIALSNILFDNGINILPIIYPAVRERESRLRFFISASHTRFDLETTVHIIEKHCTDFLNANQ